MTSKYRLIIINLYIFLLLKSKLVIFSSTYNCRMEFREVMLWGSLTKIEGQLLKDMKEENSIVALSKVRENTYQDN